MVEVTCTRASPGQSTCPGFASPGETDAVGLFLTAPTETVANTLTTQASTKLKHAKVAKALTIIGYQTRLWLADRRTSMPFFLHGSAPPGSLHFPANPVIATSCIPSPDTFAGQGFISSISSPVERQSCNPWV